MAAAAPPVVEIVVVSDWAAPAAAVFLAGNYFFYYFWICSWTFYSSMLAFCSSLLISVYSTASFAVFSYLTYASVNAVVSSVVVPNFRA